MSVLLEMSSPQTSPKKFHSLTARYREAFRLISEQNHSIRQAALQCHVSRQRLKIHYSTFVETKTLLSEYVFEEKVGRKPLLSPKKQSILRMCAHTLDSVGHPLSRVSMNDVIIKLHQQENHTIETRIPRSTLQRYRKEAKIPQKSVRNGISARTAKSQVHYIDDFAKKYDEVVKEFKIKTRLM
jgi:hypothetical protein